MSPVSDHGWRAPILAQFTPEMAMVARLTIVADPDELLTEQRILDGIRERRFELIPFEDHVAFRYAYESRFRQAWDRGEETSLVVVLRSPRADASSLPFDLLEQARRDSRILSFSLVELFPHLAPHVVAELDRADLDALFSAQKTHQPGHMGENATKDFILRHVFEIAPELIKTPAGLLRVLLRRHYSGHRFPQSLDERFIHLLRQTEAWNAWPLEEIVPGRSAFLTFLEERWPRFVRRKTNQGLDDAGQEHLRFAGPRDLPFDHDDVRVYVDNLFIEGYMAVTDVVPKSAVAGTWMAVGVAGSAETDALDRLQKLISLIEATLPPAEGSHTAWVETATRWAEAVWLRWKLPEQTIASIRSRFEALHDELEGSFAGWMQKHYAVLHNLPYLPQPVMVHHIPRFLAHQLGAGKGAKKLALVVIDGLAFDQWILLREDLAANSDLEAEMSAVFAWVPTLTTVSRQAIFSGDPPFYFAASIDSTYKEEQHWIRFWENHGSKKIEVGYICQKKQEDEAAFLSRVREVAEHPKCRILGVVVGTVDQTMHGTVLGTGGLHAAVRHWAQVGRFRDLVTMLMENGFEVFVTADHGNIEAEGIGKPDVGAIADERGQRVHVFRDELLRTQVERDHPSSLRWPGPGLPSDYLVLFAPGRRAFIPEGKRAVAHGGISLEEVIVPFARIGKRNR